MNDLIVFDPSGGIPVDYLSNGFPLWVSPDGSRMDYLSDGLPLFE
jgi:hypothetical protein